MMGSITFLEQACKYLASGSGHDVNVLAVYIISMRFGGIETPNKTWRRFCKAGERRISEDFFGGRVG
jgi:hypothetical protein